MDPAALVEHSEFLRMPLQDQISMEPLISSIAINFWKIAERKLPWALSTTLPSWMAPWHSHREMGRSCIQTRRCQWKAQPTFRQLITLRPSRQTSHLINMLLKAPSTSRLRCFRSPGWQTRQLGMCSWAHLKWYRLRARVWWAYRVFRWRQVKTKTIQGHRPKWTQWVLASKCRPLVPQIAASLEIYQYPRMRMPAHSSRGATCSPKLPSPRVYLLNSSKVRLGIIHRMVWRTSNYTWYRTT